MNSLPEIITLGFSKTRGEGKSNPTHCNESQMERLQNGMGRVDIPLRRLTKRATQGYGYGVIGDIPRVTADLTLFQRS